MGRVLELIMVPLALVLGEKMIEVGERRLHYCNLMFNSRQYQYQYTNTSMISNTNGHYPA